MSGIDFIATGGTPDPTLPLAQSTDRILTKGSLLLFDPIHSTNPMAGGIAAGQAVPNIAWAELAELLGSGTQASLAGTFNLGTGNTAASTLTERSAKGGIHVVMSQTNQNGNQQGAFIDFVAQLRAYLLANPNHEYYFSRWINRTRVSAAVSGSSALASAPAESALYSNGASATANPLEIITGNGYGGTLFSQDVDPAYNQVGPIFQSFATQKWTGTLPAAIAGYLVAWGQTIGTWQTAAYNNLSASYVFERSYLEDLTVSGRAYADVHAIDYAFWQADHAVGGRYYGDTFTAPATLA